MIAMLRGTVLTASGDAVVLDVGGVGYLATCPLSTMEGLPAVGAQATLLVETQVREDSIRLFGFLSEAERDWFRTLQVVQGVGAKVALALLGVMAPADIGAAIVRADLKAISKAPGVGARLAARIASELASAAPALMARSGDVGASPVAYAPANREAEEAISALVNLGYKPSVASEAVASAASASPDATTPALIRRSLSALSRQAA